MESRIKLDYDKKYILSRDMENFIKLFVNLREYKGLEIKKIDIKESKKGLHITIKLNKEITETESLFYATLLGSDSVRECFNYCRLLAGKKRTYNFFSRKKSIYDLETGKRKYRSLERDNTKRIRKIKRKLLYVIYRINKGLYQSRNGKFF
jgi:hypothetical protein